MGSLSQFEEDVGPLLRGHLSAGKGIGGIGFFKCVENADYFLHNFILLWLFNSGGAGLAVSERAIRPDAGTLGEERRYEVSRYLHFPGWIPPVHRRAGWKHSTPSNRIQ